MPTSDIDIAAIDARCAAATPGPWFWTGYKRTRALRLQARDGLGSIVMDFDRWGMADAQPRFRVDGLMVDAAELPMWREGGGDGRLESVAHPDMVFLAHARTDLPALVARVRELEAERDALASSLRLLVAEEGQTNHLHDRPGQWDDDGRPCHRCHAFDDARRLLGIDGAMPSYGGNHADE